jgi:hypothetical protein
MMFLLFFFLVYLYENAGIYSNRPWWLPYPSIFSVLIMSHTVLSNILRHDCYIYILTHSYPVIWIDLFWPVFYGLKLIQSPSVTAITLNLYCFLMITDQFGYLMAMPVIAVGCTALMMWQYRMFKQTTCHNIGTYVECNFGCNVGGHLFKQAIVFVCAVCGDYF